MKKLWLIAVASLAMTGAAYAQQEEMSADVIDATGNSVGTVTFAATPSGMVHITAEISGIEEGVHGFHIHETGECDPATDFESAGGHYAGDMQHGILVEGGPHPGDLPNAHVGSDGMLTVEIFTDRISLGSDGENPLADDDGSAIIVHSGADDYESQPSGDAGSRVACGVIE